MAGSCNAAMCHGTGGIRKAQGLCICLGFDALSLCPQSVAFANNCFRISCLTLHVSLEDAEWVILKAFWGRRDGRFRSIWGAPRQVVW